MSDIEVMSNLSADEDDFSDTYDFDEQDAHMQDGQYPLVVSSLLSLAD